MKNRFICSVLVLSLFATTGHAAPSVEKLQAQMAAKREQLNALSEKIITLESGVMLFKQKTIAFLVEFKEARKRKFFNENPGREITEKELNDAFMNEFSGLIKDFTDSKNRTGKYILNDVFFNSIEGAPAFKFYMLRYLHDTATLHELFSDWEKLSNEICAIAIQIESIKGL